MYIWRLRPLAIDDPSWEASSHRGPVLVRAPDEDTAREEAQKAFGIKTRFPPGMPMIGPPWRRAKLVAAEIVSHPRYEAEGEVGVLEPSFETDLQPEA